MVAARTADLSRANESLRQQREWLQGHPHQHRRRRAGHRYRRPHHLPQPGRRDAHRLAGEARPWASPSRASSALSTKRPARRARTSSPACCARGESSPWPITPRCSTRDGREVPIEDSAAPIKDSAGTVSGVVLVFHDVTEKRRAQAAMRESQRQNEMLASIIERSSQPFGIGYPDGRLGLINRAFEQLTGYSAEELRAMDWAKALTPPEWREMERQKLEELARTGQPVRYEKEYLRKDGTRVPIELLVHLARDAEGQAGILLLLPHRHHRAQAGRKAVPIERELQRAGGRTAGRTKIQTSRRAALSLAEDATEARKEAERVNADLQKANESLGTSRLRRPEPDGRRPPGPQTRRRCQRRTAREPGTPAPTQSCPQSPQGQQPRHDTLHLGSEIPGRCMQDCRRGLRPCDGLDWVRRG